MVWCTVLFFEHLDCNKRLQNEREEEWFHLGGEISKLRDITSSWHIIIIYHSSHIILCFNALHIRYQTTKTHQIEITYVAKRRVLLTTTAIHHCYLVQHHHYGDLSLVCCPVSSTRALLFTQTQTGRPGRIYSEHWVSDVIVSDVILFRLSWVG